MANLAVHYYEYGDGILQVSRVHMAAHENGILRPLADMRRGTFTATATGSAWHYLILLKVVFSGVGTTVNSFSGVNNDGFGTISWDRQAAELIWTFFLGTYICGLSGIYKNKTPSCATHASLCAALLYYFIIQLTFGNASPYVLLLTVVFSRWRSGLSEVASLQGHGLSVSFIWCSPMLRAIVVLVPAWHRSVSKAGSLVVTVTAGAGRGLVDTTGCAGTAMTLIGVADSSQFGDVKLGNYLKSIPAVTTHRVVPLSSTALAAMATRVGLTMVSNVERTGFRVEGNGCGPEVTSSADGHLSPSRLGE